MNAMVKGGRRRPHVPNPASLGMDMGMCRSKCAVPPCRFQKQEMRPGKVGLQQLAELSILAISRNRQREKRKLKIYSGEKEGQSGRLINFYQHSPSLVERTSTHAIKHVWWLQEPAPSALAAEGRRCVMRDARCAMCCSGRSTPEFLGMCKWGEGLG